MNPVYKSRSTLIALFFLFSFTNLIAQPDSTLAAKKAFVRKAVQLKTLKPEAGLGDYLKVEVANLDVLMQTAKEREERIVLYFNEIPMHGIYADFTSSRDSSLIFLLTRDTLSLKSWNIFYQGQTFDSRRQVTVSVGFENDGSIETSVKNFSLVLVRRHLLYFVLVGITVLFVLFIILVKKTGIIRDDNNIMGKLAPYSLARTQLAFWSFIIVFSFLYIYIVTGEIPPITGSTLILLTISMTTTVGARLIDTSKNPENKMYSDGSEGFFRDIISDHNNVSIHRFQMVVWTLVLGVFFLRSVTKSLSMPQFDDSMLILMGISNGTYLGLKIPEKSAVTNPEKIMVSEEDRDDDTARESPAVG
jgi:hypothetical protein